MRRFSLYIMTLIVLSGCSNMTTSQTHEWLQDAPLHFRVDNADDGGQATSLKGLAGEKHHL